MRPEDLNLRLNQIETEIEGLRLKVSLLENAIRKNAQPDSKNILDSEYLEHSDFSMEIKNLLEQESFIIGKYTLNVAKRHLTFENEEPVKLTKKEFLILIIFAANPNVGISRKYILEAIWIVDNYKNSRSMDVYICKVRKMLSRDSSMAIHNIHGKGYRLIII